MDDEPPAAETGAGARHARVNVALTQTLADLDRLRARREWPAEVDSIWEVLDQIKEAVKLGEEARAVGGKARASRGSWEELGVTCSCNNRRLTVTAALARPQQREQPRR